MKKVVFSLLLSLALISSFAIAQKKDSYRFVVIPKVIHPWFDAVNNGAKEAAKMIQTQTGAKVVIDYQAPQKADVVEQNQILERAIATKPDGIIIDLLDGQGNKAVLLEAVKRKIPIAIFDSIPPEGMALSSIGADFCEQANIAAERLVKLIGGKGEVAIMMGVPTAPNHAIRAQCHEKTFAKYKDIKVVARGIDNDDIETAQKQAAAIMQANPNLKGWVACDAAGPVGIGQAIKEAGKAGKVIEVGLDDLPEMLQLIKDGVVESTVASRPDMQGYWGVMTVWQQSLGIKTPKYIDTGIVVITKDNLTTYK